jgi:hypothetical protein
MTPARPGDAMASEASGEHMGQTVRFQEILRRLAILDENAVEQHAGLGLGLPGAHLLDAKPQSWRGSQRWRQRGHRRPAWNGASPGAGGRGDRRRDHRRAAGHRPGSRARPRRLRRAGLAIGLGYDVETALMETDDP